MTVRITDHRICLRHFQLTSSKLILFVTATSVQDLNDHNFVMSLMNRKLGAIKIGHWLNSKKLHFLLLVGLAMNHILKSWVVKTTIATNQ
ncbi:hypothetical protein DERP_007649 [Dermatophagoides pteronyssinus]|uniref:Uncharacterized protein n=1 Tax=Dermatophagoides pteronyssinus TaxID=6956 RepID=A0ABQ8JKT2_DERPT|nr:hypothetical protein DERP_007649 [Dermatophagoides pteronyssinus]